MTAPAVWGGVAIVATTVAHRAALLADLPADAVGALRWTSEVVLLGWPLALLWGLLRSRLDRSAVSRMIVELGSGLPEPARLQTVLAAALHDPSVRLAIWLPDRQVFVDVDGVPVEIGTPVDGRAFTQVERDGAASPRSTTTSRWSPRPTWSPRWWPAPGWPCRTSSCTPRSGPSWPMCRRPGPG